MACEAARRLGIAGLPIVALGDGLNDLSLVRSAAIGVAMANADPRIAAVAAAHTAAHDEDGVAVAIDSRDEFGQLAGVFNDMAATIKTQTERLQAERRAHHELLLGVLPAAAVALREAGDAEARCTFNDV
jgi:nitrogen fixation/metabolism regulation signal transduction histidine kinase